MSIHLIPSTPAGTPDAAPLAALRHRRPLVRHEEPMTVIEHLAGFPFPALDRAPDHRLFVTQQGQSSRRVISPTPGIDRSTMGATTGSITPLPRTVRAAVETLNTVTESGVNSSLPAPKAIVTVLRPWFTRQPANKGRADLSVSIAVGSDGSIAYRVTEDAYRLTSSQLIPLPGAGLVRLWLRAIPCTPTIPRRLAGRLMSQPRKEANGVSQVESRTYRIATAVGSARRRHLRIASRDDVIDAEENALTNELLAIEEALEAKADDERAGLALIRTGRTKHTRGIVVDLFPNIGPEAA